MPGGAQEDSLTTTEVAVDLTAFARREVKIWCDDQDVLFCFKASSEASTTLVTSGDSAASLSALVADKAARGVPVFRVVSPKYPILVVKTAASTGTLLVKPVSEKDRSL